MQIEFLFISFLPYVVRSETWDCSCWAQMERCTVMWWEQVQAITFVSVPSYITWSSLAPELHTLSWPLVCVHFRIFWLLSKSSTVSESERITVNKPKMRKTSCRRSSGQTRVDSMAKTKLQSFQRSLQDRRRHVRSGDKPNMLVVFFDICWNLHNEFRFLRSNC